MKNSVESLNTCIIKRASICKLKAALFTSDGKQEAFDSNINDSLRGTTPTEDVDVGDCVLEMKLDFILCDETLNKDLRLAIAEWNSETMEPASKIDKDLTLVVQLMHELYSENSVWKSYVGINFFIFVEFFRFLTNSIVFSCILGHQFRFRIALWIICFAIS